MTAAILLQPLCFREFDNNGNPLAFGTVTSYQAGTSTPTPTYTDSTAGTPNANPLTLNARGEAQIWCLPNVSYKFVVADSTGNTIRTVDNVQQSQILTLYGGVDSGAANAYIISFTANFQTLVNGIVVYFVPSNTNTGASTINVNGLGVISIKHPDGTDLVPGDLLANSAAGLMYYNGAWILLNGIYFPTLAVKGAMQSYGTTAATWVDTSADYGTFVPTFTGLGSAPTGNLNWVKNGNLVLLYTAGATSLTAISNATTMQITNLPTEIQPVNSIEAPCTGIVDNSTHDVCGAAIFVGPPNAQIINFEICLVSGSYVQNKINGFTATGTKGLNGFSCVYALK